MSEILSLDAQTAHLDPDRVFIALGYPRPEAATDPVRKAVPDLIFDARKIARPRATIHIALPESVEKDRVVLVGGPTFTGRRLARALAPATNTVLFAMTLGSEMSDWLSGLTARNTWTGFVADAIASELTEAAADVLQDQVSERFMSQDLFVGPRFSPGYCDWPIEQMPVVLDHIQAENIGIRLTSGGMMNPEKSICGIMGVGPDSKKIALPPCVACDQEDCPYRRIPPS